VRTGIFVIAGLVAFNAACGAGGDSIGPRPAPPPVPQPQPPPPPTNNAPAVAETIPDQEMIVGQTMTVDISGAFTDPDGDALTLRAASSNTGVATASVSGNELSVTGVAAGTASVTVTAGDPGGLSATQSFDADVAAVEPTVITVTPDSVTLIGLGRTVQLSVEVLDQLGRPISDPGVIWTSGDTLVVTIDSTGTVESEGSGDTNVTGTAGAVSDTVRVSVTQNIESVTISPAVDTVAVGDTVRLTATAVDENGHRIASALFGWSSLNGAVASVDQTGLVRGVSEGRTTIIATAAGEVATAMVTVFEPPPPPGLWRGLVVAPEDRCSEYIPDHYRHDANLKRRILEKQRVGGHSGFYQPYTGTYFWSSTQTDIEHIVDKSEAHDSGGCAWTRDERREFADDLVNLTLASPTLNRHQKGAKDAAEWLPEINRCWFAATIVEVRVKYALTVDEAERDVLESILSGCESTDMIRLPVPWHLFNPGGGEPIIARSRYDPPLIWQDEEIDGTIVVRPSLIDVRGRMTYACSGTAETVRFELSHDPELDWTTQQDTTYIDRATLQWGSESDAEEVFVFWTAGDPKTIQLLIESDEPVFESVGEGEIDSVTLDLSSPLSRFEFPLGYVGSQAVTSLRRDNECVAANP